MSDTQESSSAILAEARDKYTVHDCDECDFRKSCESSFGSDECKRTRKSISLALGIEDDYFTKLLDRIEAAVKRERAITDAMLAVKDKPLPHPDPEHAPPNYPCSAAALREALEDSQSLLESFSRGEYGAQVREQMRDNRAALAAPARNCDVTKDEAEEGFRREFGRPWNTVEDRLAAWLFAQ